MAPPALGKPGWRDRIAPGRLLRTMLARRGAIVTALGPDWRHELDFLRDTRLHVALLMSDAAALQIQICVRAAQRLGGAMAEAGVLMGGSARLICEAKQDAPLHLFDVFENLQAPATAAPVSGEDEIRTHFGTVHGARAGVEALLWGYPNVHIHAGIFPHSAACLGETRFSFVHLDMDLPGSTRAALDFFHPRLLPGGILIGDDFEDAEVRAIFRDFFAGRGDMMIELPWGQVMIVRV